jgi:hypothetical protein
MEATKCEVAWRASWVAAKRSTVHIEGEATSEPVITIWDLPREVVLSSVVTTALNAENKGG